MEQFELGHIEPSPIPQLQLNEITMIRKLIYAYMLTTLDPKQLKKFENIYSTLPKQE